MAELINLNKVRKAKQKQTKVEQALQNRILHGLSGKVKQLHRLHKKHEDKILDQHKIKRALTIKKVDDE